jgi:hypothetical protein
MEAQTTAYILLNEIDRINEDLLSDPGQKDHRDFYLGMIQAYKNTIKTIYPDVEDFGVGINLGVNVS